MHQLPFNTPSPAAASPAPAPAAPAAAGASSSPEINRPADPWRAVRRNLLGRHRLAVFLGVWAGVLGAVIGWYSCGPVYRSEGLVRIASALPQVLEETDQNRPMAMFDAYLQSQQMLMGSRGLHELALQDDAWVSLGRSTSAADAQKFAENLKIEFRPRTDYLRVFYIDPDPVVAAAAVQSLINAYERVYQSQQSDLRKQRIKALEERRTTLNTRLEKLRAEIQARVAELGTANLEPLYLSTMQQAIKLEQSINEVRQALARAADPTAGQGAQDDKPAAPPAIADLTPEQIAFTDPLMRGYIDQRSKKEEEVTQLKSYYKENHPLLVRANEALDRAKSRVEEYAQTAREMRAAAAAAAPVGSGKNAAPRPALPKSPQALRNEEANLTALQAKVKLDVANIGANRITLERLKSDEELARKELADVSRRIGVMDAEEALGGRLTVVSRGDIPLAPVLDRRFKASALGLVLGFMFPGSMLVLAGVLRPRYRACQQVAVDLAARAPLFGVVPELPEDLEAGGTSASAARCIHQMRVRLGTAAKHRRSSVYLVTSAGAGEGKSSLTLSLGASFAAAGFKTLVIDGDLAARGITLGFGSEGLPGLREAADGAATLANCIRGTREGFCFLPTGMDDQLNAYAVPQNAIEQLVEALRNEFDVILIDTGAVFGSIEASVLAPQADGVIFTVACGQREFLVGQSLKHLDSLGATLAGIIFNGADHADFSRTVYTAGGGQFFKRRRLREPVAEGPNIVTGFGPLVDSVVSSLPSNRVREFEALYQNPASPHSNISIRAA